MRKTLSIDQIRALLTVISRRGTKRARILDRALIISVLLSGSGIRLWTWKNLFENLSDTPYAAFDAIRILALSRRLVIVPFNSVGFKPHDWGVNKTANSPIFSVYATPLTTQEITRRMKRYARLAGIPEVDANLRTLNNTYQMLLRTYGNSEAAAHALGLPTIWDRPSQEQFSHLPIRDPRLHGIGRRGRIRTA